ncbi:MAG: AAA family ATPase [Gammaproteobacteria bacterium]|nr:MAG: AAA family ATPase [Gammaproteobacteria bacterium]
MPQTVDNALNEVNQILLGKEQQVKLAFTCLLASGHLLLEDIPGLGKTTLSHTLAKVLGLTYQRIQFTSDLLPSDVLGVSVFEKDSGKFHFLRGPIFSQLLLADEINRATPKAQSALLEAMEENQVTTEGETRPLPSPFFVIATQNPLEQAGTYPLPESQLDRFLMRLHLGYPPPHAELYLLKGKDRRSMIDELQTCITPKQLRDHQRCCDAVTASDTLLAYLMRLVNYTRESPEFNTGLSPRGGLALLKAAKAWAFMHDRDYVLPEDIQIVLPSVVIHRVGTQRSFDPNSNIIDKLLSEVTLY